jgi:hypothetical protein
LSNRLDERWERHDVPPPSIAVVIPDEGMYHSLERNEAERRLHVYDSGVGEMAEWWSAPRGFAASAGHHVA